jgi:membrane fusion protein (multidrug efflux system)
MTSNVPLSRLLAAVVAAGLAALATGCGPAGRASADGANAGLEEEAALEPVTVALAPVEQGDIHDYLVTTSVLRAVSAAEVSAEVAGAVEALEVEEGEWVRRGDVLARVDLRQLGLAERKARGAFEKARAAHERALELDARGLLSREDLEAARFEAGQAEISWKEAELARDQATVRSPIDGVVAKREVRLGVRVSVGSVLFSVVDPRRLQVDLHLPERHLAALSVGQPCRLSTQGDESAGHAAEVVRISPVVDSESGTVKVVARLTPPAAEEGSSGPALRPGQFVRVRLVTATHAQALLVPKKAVVWDEERPLVFVREDGKAVARRFEPGLEDGDRLEAVSGLEPELEVIVAGHAALREGTPVRTPEEALQERRGDEAPEALAEGGPEAEAAGDA